MSVVERARERIGELRTRIEDIRSRIRSRTPILGQGSEGGLLGQGVLEFPRLKELRERIRGQGVIPTLEERFPKLKEIRARRPLLGSKGVKGDITDLPPPVGMSVEGKPKKPVDHRDIAVQL